MSVEYIFTRDGLLPNKVRKDYHGKIIHVEKEVESALPGKEFHTHMSGNLATFTFAVALDAADLTILSGAIQDHKDNADNLAAYKHLKNLTIDDRTSELISSGFVYDSTRFSLSRAAQTNWTNIYYGTKDGIMTPPINVSTMDDGEYTLQDASGVTSFYGLGLSYIQAQYDSGRALKLQVNACSSYAGVDSIVDTR